MDYEAEIIVKEDAGSIHKCLLNEKISRERSTLNIRNTERGLRIRIEARDASALRATLNAVTQVIAVYSRMKGVGSKNG